jgi:hypothetical protein
MSEYSGAWYFWLAWRPVQLLNGKWVWWEIIQRRWNEDGGNWIGDFSGYAFPVGVWEYRICGM